MSISETPALDAWNAKVSTPERMQLEIERLRAKAQHDEAQALYNARQEERAKWQDVVADKDAEIALLRKQLDERS